MVKTKKDYATEFARKGGKARAVALTAAQRTAIARKGGKARQGKAAARKKARP